MLNFLSPKESGSSIGTGLSPSEKACGSRPIAHRSPTALTSCGAGPIAWLWRSALTSDAERHL